MKYIFGFLMIFLLKFGFSQTSNYHIYYSLINEAEYLNYSERYKDSFSKYIQAFKLNFPFKKDLYKASNLSNILLEKGDSSFINEQKFINELYMTFFNEDIYLKVFIDDSTKLGLITFFPYLNLIDFSRPSIETIEITTRLSNYLSTDKLIRKTTKENIQFRDRIIRTFDSIQYTELVSYILRNGMPDRKLIGYYYHHIHVILLHGSYHVGISPQLEKLLLLAIPIGNYHPSNFAFLIDKYKVWNLNEPQTYGQFGDKNYELKNIFDVDKVNERRQSIGLESLVEYAKKNYFIIVND